jgi:hypothetical protein
MIVRPLQLYLAISTANLVVPCQANAQTVAECISFRDAGGLFNIGYQGQLASGMDNDQYIVFSLRWCVFEHGGRIQYRISSDKALDATMVLTDQQWEYEAPRIRWTG